MTYIRVMHNCETVKEFQENSRANETNVLSKSLKSWRENT